MREPVIIIWTILLIVFTMVFMFVLKKLKRSLGKYEMFYKLFLFILMLGLSFLLYYFIDHSTTEFVWTSRLIMFSIGILNVWAMYKRKWTVRDSTDFEEDAFFPEMLFVTVGGIVGSLAFVLSPQLFGVVLYEVDVSRFLWALPLWYMLPFVFLKLMDFSGQIPIKMVENPWIYPLEATSPEKWPWRDLVQVNFEVKKSLIDEYNFFSWTARPWIEAPKDVTLGKIYQLCIQERRKNSDLSLIQDMGDEYGGTPKFCWIFSIKIKWYNPTTWYRKPRYVNPNLSIVKNEIRRNDVIIARRITGDGAQSSGFDFGDIEEDDSEKTVIIIR